MVCRWAESFFLSREEIRVVGIRRDRGYGLQLRQDRCRGSSFPTRPILNPAIFLQAAVGFFWDGVFDQPRFQHLFYQVIQIASGLGFTELLSDFLFAESVTLKKFKYSIGHF